MFFNLIFSINIRLNYKYFLKEDFKNLKSWESVLFYKTDKPTIFTILSKKSNNILSVKSIDSASGIVFRDAANTYNDEIITWRWKVNIYPTTKTEGEKYFDDYALRIMVIFKFDTNNLSFFDNIKYNVAKLVYPKFPPHSVINYIWLSRKAKEKIYDNPYFYNSKNIVLKTILDKTNTWYIEQVDLVEDYIKAFKEKPPKEYAVIIFSDSDSTHSSALSFIDYFYIRNNNDKKNL